VRTNIDIDEELLREAMAAMGTATKRATIDEALRRLIALKAHERVVAEAFRLQEIERQTAEREGQLGKWHANLVTKGNWPRYPDDADQR
jgi:Arc/MetJ family transcription regulator